MGGVGGQATYHGERGARTSLPSCSSPLPHVGFPCAGGADDRDFLQWLNETVAEAVLAAEQHESMKKVLREVRASVEGRFKLNTVQVG